MARKKNEYKVEIFVSDKEISWELTRNGEKVVPTLKDKDAVYPALEIMRTSVRDELRDYWKTKYIESLPVIEILREIQVTWENVNEIIQLSSQFERIEINSAMRQISIWPLFDEHFAERSDWLLLNAKTHQWARVLDTDHQRMVEMGKLKLVNESNSDN